MNCTGSAPLVFHLHIVQFVLLASCCLSLIWEKNMYSNAHVKVHSTQSPPKSSEVEIGFPLLGLFAFTPKESKGSATHGGRWMLKWPKLTKFRTSCLLLSFKGSLHRCMKGRITITHTTWAQYSHGNNPTPQSSQLKSCKQPGVGLFVTRIACLLKLEREMDLSKSVLAGSSKDLTRRPWKACSRQPQNKCLWTFQRQLMTGSGLQGVGAVLWQKTFHQACFSNMNCL